MWFGLLYEKPAAGEEDVALALVYRPEHILTGGGPIEGLANFVWAFRQAAAETGGAEPPRCSHCDWPLDVPPVDDEELACASS